MADTVAAATSAATAALSPMRTAQLVSVSDGLDGAETHLFRLTSQSQPMEMGLERWAGSSFQGAFSKRFYLVYSSGGITLTHEQCGHRVVTK